MPELNASARAAGGWVDPDAVRVRHYTPDQLGGVCKECLIPVPAALADDIEPDTHPTCDPDWVSLVAQSRRATRRATPPEGA